MLVLFMDYKIPRSKYGNLELSFILFVIKIK
jgi:hypothetical protein